LNTSIDGKVQSMTLLAIIDLILSTYSNEVRFSRSVSTDNGVTAHYGCWESNLFCTICIQESKCNTRSLIYIEYSRPGIHQAICGWHLVQTHVDP
jgi:hypothetical protein